MLTYLWRILFIGIFTILLLLFYFLYTSMGLRHAYSLLGYGVSQKLGFDVEVGSINLHRYPFVQAKLRIEEEYTLSLQGYINSDDWDMKYTLHNSSLLEINGTLIGHMDDFNITATSTALLGYLSDAQLNIEIQRGKEAFSLHLESQELQLRLDQGHYSQQREEGEAIFELKVAELSRLKKLMRKTYKGPLEANGTIAYAQGLRLEGISETLLGKVPFGYHKEELEVTLKNSSFQKLSQLLNTQTSFDANLSGRFAYNILHDTVETQNLRLQREKERLEGRLKAKLASDLDLSFEGSYNTHYKLTLTGLLGDDFINMDYTLHSKRLPSPIITIIDDVHTQGHVNGSFAHLHITGAGTALDGNVSYEMIKLPKSLENVTLDLKDIRTAKLATLLGYPQLPDGKSDITAHLDTLSSKSQLGQITYAQKGSYLTLPFSLDAYIKLKGTKHHFESNLSMVQSRLLFREGSYDILSKRTHLKYQMHSPALDKLAVLLEYRYLGGLDTKGELSYDKALLIQGDSTSYGGLTTYTYQGDRLAIQLANCSFDKIMNLLPYRHLLEAKTSGEIRYDFNRSVLDIDTKLQGATLLPSSVVKVLEKKGDLSLDKEVFEQSSLVARYANNQFVADLNLSNPQGYISLSKAKIEGKENKIDANFDINLQGKLFSGKILGTTKKPKIKLNMQKLLKHEIKKYMGEENHKLMKSLPMGEVAEDMAADVGAELMDLFF